MALKNRRQRQQRRQRRPPKETGGRYKFNGEIKGGRSKQRPYQFKTRANANPTASQLRLAPRLLPADFAAEALVDCVGVVAYAGLEDHFWSFDCGDVFGEVAVEQDQVGLLACGYRADAV